MRRLNDGMIHTNDNCIGCNRCISKCPVNSANVSVISGGKTQIGVDAEKCIHCGACIEACKRNARGFTDDSLDFFRALKIGQHMSVIIDPAFRIIYGDELKHVIATLRFLGIEKIYDGAFGAEISLWRHVKYIYDNKDNPDRAFIGNTCPAITSYIEHYKPDMLKYLIPVETPDISTAIYARKYLEDPRIMVLLSPCPSMKDDMLSNGNIISYNICFDSLMSNLQDIDPKDCNDEFDLEAEGTGVLSSLSGGFKYMIEPFLKREEILMNLSGMDKEAIDRISLLAEDDITRPVFVDMEGCEHGCIFGAGAREAFFDYRTSNIKIQELKNSLKESIRGKGDPKSNYDALSERFKDLDPDDFIRQYTDRFRQMSKVPESSLNAIFEAMYKDTESKRHIDCGSCGYKTCYDMAEAIAYGNNKMENCIHYMNDELLMRYYTDNLTGIPNKEGFRHKAEKLYEENPDKTYVIAAVSINQLNLINDLHGFSLGDAVIRRAAEISMKFTEKRSNGCCGRLGGGEFLLCFENTKENMDRAHSCTIFSFDDIGVSFPLSFRAGMYIDTDRDETLETMINYASLARDKIVEDGISTCLFYNDELKERLAAEAMVTSQMVKAIENGEFVAYYQPQYSHKTGKVVGAETLCRWVKKDGSIISPGLFIPIFEKNGFIKALDKYMWELAFKSAMKWQNEKYEAIPISVNISRVSLDEADFTDSIFALYEKYPIDSKRLHFEITESAYSDRQDMVAQKINALRERGFLVAMDDFGSGYSSLNVLKDMPLDILKLDMGFLRGKNRERGEAIIRNVVAMVRELQLEIVTEGVETMEQAEFLRHVGCDIIQGYLYARPMPEDEYERLITKDEDTALYREVIEHDSKEYNNN